jgi:hypothetical protein
VKLGAKEAEGSIEEGWGRSRQRGRRRQSRIGSSRRWNWEWDSNRGNNVCVGGHCGERRGRGGCWGYIYSYFLYLYLIFISIFICTAIVVSEIDLKKMISLQIAQIMYLTSYKTGDESPPSIKHILYLMAPGYGLQIHQTGSGAKRWNKTISIFLNAEIKQFPYFQYPRHYNDEYTSSETSCVHFNKLDKHIKFK